MNEPAVATDKSMNEDPRDEFDIFLEDWKPSEVLAHATLESNLHDPLAQARLIEDSTAAAKLIRTEYVEGTKEMSDSEVALRKHAFFEEHQASWSAHFRDYVLGKGVEERKFDQFVHDFTNLWVDGKRRRQGSPEMMAIKASIRNHDLQFQAANAGRYVLTPVPDVVPPLFDASEIEAIFRANETLLESFMPDYLCELEGDRGGSINRLYVRRGVFLPAAPGPVLKELHYLSSYSLALGPVEQFAQTWTSVTKHHGVPSIFSAPLPALQTRVVAFAPFIKGMDLRQLEMIVAPPVRRIQLKESGTHGGIHEYEFE